jgi:integrase
MRLKDYDERDGKRVWLSESELSLLLDEMERPPEHRAAGLLMGRCGLRRDEAAAVTPSDLVSTDHGQVVRVWDGKGDKYREVPAPDELVTLVLGLDRSPGATLVDVADSTLWDWVNQAAQRCRAATGDEGWQFVGPHDLRRSWGVRALESGVLPSVVMEWGGWEDWQTFRDHYLAEFSPEALRREREKVSWLDGGREAAQADANPGYSAVQTGSQNQYSR